MSDISQQVKKPKQKSQSPRNVFSGRDKNLSNISKNYLEDFDGHSISNFDDGRNSGLYSNTPKKMKMNNRKDIFDLRADAIQMEQKKSNQVQSIKNILNDEPFGDGPDFFNQNR